MPALIRWGVSLIGLLLISGCVQNVRPESEQLSAHYAIQPVYFATNRGLTGKSNLNRFFNSDRDALRYGISSVAVPANYPKANAASFIHWNMTVARNPEKHLALINIDLLDAGSFYQRLAEHSSSESPSLFLIHGYNISFEKASRLSAKINYDLGLSGPATLFSWPSEESVAQYPIDEVNLRWAQPDLNQMLTRLLSQSEDSGLILMAHSLGNRALIAALLSILPERPDLSGRIRGVVLAAPDIDAEIFERDLAPELAKLQLPITLYTSRRDLALIASHRLHGYPRAGASILSLPGIDLIDASEAESEWLGHEYVSQGSHTIADIYYWLIEGLSPAQRPGLQTIQDEQSVYWRIRPQANDGSDHSTP